MQSMSAYVAQNHGAGRIDRAAAGLRIAMLVSTSFGAVMFWAAYFHGDALCSVFTPDRAVVEAGFDYLRAYGIDCLLTCFLFCFIGFFNGMGHTTFVMVQGLAAAFLVRVPVAAVMSRTVGTLFSIGLGIPCSTVVEIALCAAYLLILRKKRALS